ncbi:MAG TPA: shikimate dehydrogenase, partial [Terrimesophilobacter sp.]|nr:shikimate dehydrogenase [Terrimesophilobacter sp.]
MLGSPISHSKSPALHAAAYRVLGLDWSFEAIELAEGGVRDFFRGLDDSWRGFAVTMPLKRAVFDQVDDVDAVARLAGAINTIVCGESSRWGFNTDVYGIER